jgi:hypothetical protein
MLRGAMALAQKHQLGVARLPEQAPRRRWDARAQINDGLKGANFCPTLTLPGSALGQGKANTLQASGQKRGFRQKSKGIEQNAWGTF